MHTLQGDSASSSSDEDPSSQQQQQPAQPQQPNQAQAKTAAAAAEAQARSRAKLEARIRRMEQLEAAGQLSSGFLADVVANKMQQVGGGALYERLVLVTHSSLHCVHNHTVHCLQLCWHCNPHSTTLISAVTDTRYVTLLQLLLQSYRMPSLRQQTLCRPHCQH
jgi:ATPase subunit of ABC transporter with duplicated ATPase domains